MRHKALTFIAAGLAFLSVAIPVAAHHSIAAAFDVRKAVTLKGTITEIVWTNPHIYFFMDVNLGGQVEPWVVEGGAPNSLHVRGWRQDSLKPGDTVTVAGWQAKDGSHLVNSSSVTLEDGMTLYTEASDIFGKW
jgi:hypothetical protein